MSTETNVYKNTLNLPTTRFDMKANLSVREPRIQEQWRSMDLYGRIREARVGRTRKILHDGPPYANGDIHIGHLLNKVLKDMVTRWFNLSGFDSPYVPGWDCHGLPIETKVAKDLGAKAREMSPMQVRGLCHQEAMKWVNIQRDQFQRLGVLGDWSDPYLTLDPRYEAGIMDVLADLVEKGYVFRQLKPIHWDIHDRTALAEAELEYAEVTSPSIFVNFPMVSGVPAEWGDGPWHAMIWTTTPWTLPANTAIAVHSRMEYAGVRYQDPKTGETVQTILAVPLIEKVLSLAGVKEHQEVGRVVGARLEHAQYRHVFLDRTSPVVLAEYVGAEDGTGLVHTAPGHGADDYRTGLNYQLLLLCPVDASGRFNDDAPEWLRGKGVFQANPDVVAKLREIGALFHDMPIRHSYPHGWRSHKPVIFRATEQWFIKVDHDGLRERTMENIEKVEWIPAWGQRRIESMISTRPDWCISRQRAWGVPIPALACVKCGEQHLSAESVRHFRDLFRQEGADAWFSKSASELVPAGLTCSNCGCAEFEKGGDILDVWFESGSSHRGVLSKDFNLGFPAAMYLEGSDQHRGWFQSSILTAVGANGRAPFETVLTHGFIVDDSGRKMSKSLGNVVPAVESTEKYGADVLRLYVASMDYSDDIRMSDKGIKEASEAYRKIRNTFRFLLGNLEDYAKFDPTNFDVSQLQELDRYLLGRLNTVIRDSVAAYNRYEFYRVYQTIYQFCSVDLSSFYLDVTKDRLYADSADGVKRQSTLYVMHRLHDVLTRLLAPILCHTAEELWEFLPSAPNKLASVHLAECPEPDAQFDDPARDQVWNTLKGVRSDVLRQLEKLRAAKEIGSAQAASVTVGSDDPELAGLLADRSELLTTLCVVSEVIVANQKPSNAVAGEDQPQLWVLAAKSAHSKCPRCWNYAPSIGQNSEHPLLCARCASVI